MSELTKYIDYNNELLERMDIIIDYINSIKEGLVIGINQLKEKQKPETNNIEV